MDTAWVAFTSFLDKHQIPYTQNRGGQRPKIVLPWGHPQHPHKGHVYFRGLDKPSSILGPNLGWGWIDEAGSLRDEEGFRNFLSRIRDPKAVLLQKIITTTGEASWLRDRFGGQSDGSFKVYSASTRENKAIDPSYVESLERELGTDSPLAKCYIDGGFLPPQTGLVYHAFDPDRNIDDSIQYNPSVPIVLSCDFNVHPMAWVVCQEYGESIVVIDEFALPNSNTPDAAERFVQSYGGHTAGFIVSGDPAGRQRATQGDRTDYDIIRETFERYGCKRAEFQHRSRDPGQRNRVNCLNRLFRAVDGSIRCRIHSRCANLIDDLRTISWDQHGKIDKGMVNRRMGWTKSHWSDALSYRAEYRFPIRKPIVVRR